MPDKYSTTHKSNDSACNHNEPEQSSKDMYYALSNSQEQFSLWPNYKKIPEGWKVQFGPADKKDCIDYVDKTWFDMRPLTSRD